MAINVILVTKDKQRIDKWERVHRSLDVEIEDKDKLFHLNKVLSLGFNDLPYYLKSYFFAKRTTEQVRLLVTFFVHVWGGREVIAANLVVRFKKLKLLGIDKFDELRCEEVKVGELSCLEKLSIQHRKLLEKAPLSIEHLKKLKML
ncbi:unnamed protein product [Dovyalis caffra]|uniref:Uncharacterized protein n=1 Tax=Dovyalis caffra TaxID=77055 RepID=A0AAV1SSB8_9ROSI|nr:unnamed protein product [Dovyalis caffra]